MTFRKMKKILRKNGFRHDRNRGGSAIFTREVYSVPIPVIGGSNKDIKPGIVRSLFQTLEWIFGGNWPPLGMA